MELSEELIAKAKGTKTPEELAALAKESSIDLTEEEAKAYFEQLHPKTGELSDESWTTWLAAVATQRAGTF